MSDSAEREEAYRRAGITEVFGEPIDWREGLADMHDETAIICQMADKIERLRAALRELIEHASIEWMERTTVGAGAPEPEPIRRARETLAAEDPDHD